MALNAMGRLEVVFRFTDKSAPGTASARANIRQLGTTAVGVAKQTRGAFLGAFPAFLTLGVLRQMTAGVAAMLKPALDYQEALASMRIFADAGDKSVKQFATESMPEFVNIARAGVRPLHEVIEGFTELSKKGLDANFALKATAKSAMIATVANTDLVNVTDLAFTLHRAFGVKADELSHRLDQVALAANKSAIDWADLAEIIKRTTSGVLQSGPAFEDFLFVLAKTRDTSQSAAVAGTQVRIAYTDMAKHLDKISAALGVPTVEEGTGRIRQLSEVMFEAVADGSSVSQVMQKLSGIVGEKAVGAFTGLGAAVNDAMRQSKGDIDEARKIFFKFREELVNAGPEIERAMRLRIMNDVRLQMKLLAVDTEILAATFGTKLTPAVSGLVLLLDRGVRVLTEVVGGTDQLNEALNEQKGWWDVTVEIANRAVVIFAGVSLAIAGLRAALTLLGGAFSFAFFGQQKMLVAAAGLTAQQATGVGVIRLWTAAIREQAGSLLVYSTGLMGATAGMTGLGRAAMITRTGMKLLALTLGPIGIAAAILASIAPFFMNFDEDLNRAGDLQGKGMSQLEKQAALLRKNGDEAGAKFLEAALIIQKVLGKKITPIDPKVFDKALGMLPKLPEDLKKQLGAGAIDTVMALKEQFGEMAAAQKAGKVIPPETMAAMGIELANLRSVFAVAAAQGGAQGKAAEEMVERLDGMAKAVSDSSEGMVEFEKRLEILRGGGTVAVETRNAELATAAATAAAPELARKEAKTKEEVGLARSQVESAFGVGAIGEFLRLLGASQGWAGTPPTGATAPAGASPGPRKAPKTTTDDVVSAVHRMTTTLASQPTVRIKVDDLADAQARTSAAAASRGNMPE